MSKIPSVVDLINTNETITNHNPTAEIAATVKQQELMSISGELLPVVLVGPNGTAIPAFFHKAENAFVPKFNIDKSE